MTKITPEDATSHQMFERSCVPSSSAGNVVSGKVSIVRLFFEMTALHHVELA